MDKALIFQNLQYLKKKVTSQVLKKSQYKQQQLQMKITNMLLNTQQSKKRKQRFVDEKGNAIPGVAEITWTRWIRNSINKKKLMLKAKIKELENKGYELVV